jgi:hypothetical protein
LSNQQQRFVRSILDVAWIVSIAPTAKVTSRGQNDLSNFMWCPELYSLPFLGKKMD